MSGSKRKTHPLNSPESAEPCERCKYDPRCMEHICNTGNAYLVEECKYNCDCHPKYKDGS